MCTRGQEQTGGWWGGREGVQGGRPGELGRSQRNSAKRNVLLKDDHRSRRVRTKEEENSAKMVKMVIQKNQKDTKGKNRQEIAGGDRDRGVGGSYPQAPARSVETRLPAP